jgi:hypothetical protein
MQELMPYINTVEIIRALDDEPNDVGGLSADDLKAKFDQFAQEFSNFFNEDFLPDTKSKIEAAINAAADSSTRIRSYMEV